MCANRCPSQNVFLDISNNIQEHSERVPLPYREAYCNDLSETVQNETCCSSIMQHLYPFNETWREIHLFHNLDQKPQKNAIICLEEI